MVRLGHEDSQGEVLETPQEEKVCGSSAKREAPQDGHVVVWNEGRFTWTKGDGEKHKKEKRARVKGVATVRTSGRSPTFTEAKNEAPEIK